MLPSGGSWPADDRINWLKMLGMGFQVAYGADDGIEIKKKEAAKLRRPYFLFRTRSISVSASLIAKARLTRVIPDLLLPSSNLTSHRQPVSSVN